MAGKSYIDLSVNFFVPKDKEWNIENGLNMTLPMPKFRDVISGRPLVLVLWF